MNSFFKAIACTFTVICACAPISAKTMAGHASDWSWLLDCYDSGNFIQDRHFGTLLKQILPSVSKIVDPDLSLQDSAESRFTGVPEDVKAEENNRYVVGTGSMDKFAWDRALLFIDLKEHKGVVAMTSTADSRTQSLFIATTGYPSETELPDLFKKHLQQWLNEHPVPTFSRKFIGPSGALTQQPINKVEELS